MKKVLFFLSVMAFLLASPKGISAQYGGYQPGGNFSIVIDKLVSYPVSEKGGTITYNYVDNLSASDFKYNIDQYVFFKLKVRNTSNSELTGVVINDTAPAGVTLYDNPGTFDTTNRILRIDVGTLTAGQEKEYIVRGRIENMSTPVNSTTCVINKAVASNDKVSDEDTSQFCIENVVTVPPTTTIPQTGAEGVVLAGLASMLGYIGLRAKKYSA